MSTELFHVTEHLVAGQHIREYARGTSQSQDDVLQLSVKQYTPKEKPKSIKDAVTVVGAHANGFPKVCMTGASGRMITDRPRSSMSPFGTRC
jgi:hypothetical protein